MPRVRIRRPHCRLPLIAGRLPAAGPGDPPARTDPMLEGAVRLEIPDARDAGAQLCLLESCALRDADGLRWAPRGSACCRRCHAFASDRMRHADLRDEDLRPIPDRICDDNPDVEAIDTRFDALIRRPGLHLFAWSR